jgi:hypothetical protein
MAPGKGDVVIGKPEWFERRKYSGWGLTPKTWQGWLYIIALMMPLAILTMFTFLTAEQQMVLALAWAAFMAIDVLDIMARLKKDEREEKHEALAERNAAWLMVAVLSCGLAFQAASSVASKTLAFDPFLALALFAGLAAKAFTNWKLSKEN